VEGVCPTVVGEGSDTSGRVGSTATINIDAGSQSIGGPYAIIWSKTPITEESVKGTDYFVLVEDEFPRDVTKVTVTFTVPESAYGNNYVQYRRSWRPQDPYGFAFTVLPDINVNPLSGLPGSKVTIKGSGFPANEDVTLSFDGKDTEPTISTNALGSFSADFTIPDTIAGKHEFKTAMETMSLGNISASIQVKPRITLDPQHPEVGSQVTVTGSGFAAGSQVSIKFNNVAIADSPTTDQTGNFSHSFNVPESSQDQQVVTATDKAGNVATSGLTLEAEPPPSPNLLYPCDGQRFGWFGPQPVTFKWQPVEDPSGVTYTFEVGTNTQVWPPTVTRTGLTGTTCAIRLEPGTYFWQVKAIDGAGNVSKVALAPYPFKVGFFSIWLVVGGIIIFAIIFILIVRAFFRRVREYYK